VFSLNDEARALVSGGAAEGGAIVGCVELATELRFPATLAGQTRNGGAYSLDDAQVDRVDELGQAKVVGSGDPREQAPRDKQRR
jgi:hypothetical protein